jgi:hypothetical protein
MKLSVGLGMIQELSPYKDFAREAAKAFRRFHLKGVDLYTCNVKRLQACNRLGEEKEVGTWRTHFFLQSSHFADVDGVVYNKAPGKELADFSTQMLPLIYVMIDERTILNAKTGERTVLDEPLVFSSDEDS